MNEMNRLHNASGTGLVPVFKLAFFQNYCHYMTSTYTVINVKLVNATHSHNSLENMVMPISLNIKYKKYITGTSNYFLSMNRYYAAYLMFSEI